MPTKKTKLLELLFRAYKAKDAKEIEGIAGEADDEDIVANPDGGDTHIHIGAQPEGAQDSRVKYSDEKLDEMCKSFDERFKNVMDAIEELRGLGKTGDKDPDKKDDDKKDDLTDDEVAKELEEEAPDGLEAPAALAKDSAYLHESFRDTVARAEILVPGIDLPKFDMQAPPKVTLKAIHNLRKKALDKALTSTDTAVYVQNAGGSKKLSITSMGYGGIRALFSSATMLRKQENTMRNNVARDASKGNAEQTKSEPLSIAEINKRNKEFWSKQ